MPRVVALLSWFEEHEGALAACVASLGGAVDHVVAVDGAYALYPGGRAKSGAHQAEAIRETARALKMGCTIFEPQTVWRGNEVEKRSYMFRLAETLTTEDDWYMVIDADELVTDWGGVNVKARLDETDKDVAQVTLWNRRPHLPAEGPPPFFNPLEQQEPLRMFFRAIRGLHVSGMHFHYKCPDGRFLWADGAVEIAEPEQLLDVRVEHRSLSRDPTRRQDSQEYYNRRVKAGIEGRLG